MLIGRKKNQKVELTDLEEVRNRVIQLYKGPLKRKMPRISFLSMIRN